MSVFTYLCKECLWHKHSIYFYVFVLLIIFAPLLQNYVVLHCYAVVSIIILSPHINTTMFFFILYLGVKRSLKCNKYTNAIHPANANMCCSQLKNDHRTKMTAAIKQQFRKHLIIEMRVCLHWLSIQHSSQVTSRLLKNLFIQQADFKQAAFYSMKLEKQFQCHFQLELLLLEPKASWVTWVKSWPWDLSWSHPPYFTTLLPVLSQERQQI